MYDAPPGNDQPASHYEYVIETDHQKAQQIKQKAFEYMDQLTGWCSYDKAAVLIDLILKHKPEKILEIGVWGGKSLVPMAYALKESKKGKIYGIDPWDAKESIKWSMNDDNINCWRNLDHFAILYDLITKIEQFQLVDQIELIISTSEDAAPIHDIDILHIDGNHSDPTSYLDATKWVPYVKSGGWIIFDDMTWYENGTFTTARAVGWLNEHCIKIAEFNDNCVWGIWVKP
ncbi:MAG TPA: class I SAM-dependent methyltransferase [Rhabdochlamydiaceae bacterium]|nr:class I SAM-dependent methyltransferase [Rhabdochlamydiaceae bacterium]